MKLPDDVLLHIFQLLAAAVVDDPEVVETLDALAGTCSTCNRIMSTSRHWDTAAQTMGLASYHHSSAYEMLVRATAHAELTMRANLGKSCTHGCGLPCMYSIALPRSGGWLDATIRGLEQLGLAVTTRSAPLTLSSIAHEARRNHPTDPTADNDEAESSGVEDDDSYLLPAGVPFVLVMCDAADPSLRPCGINQLRTYPCAEARCMDPAAIGCIHCSKHGSKGAKRVVERVSQIALQRSDANDPPRHIVFAAPSGSLQLKESYRKAILGVKKAHEATTACHPLVGARKRRAGRNSKEVEPNDESIG